MTVVTTGLALQADGAFHFSRRNCQKIAICAGERFIVSMFRVLLFGSSTVDTATAACCRRRGGLLRHQRRLVIIGRAVQVRVLGLEVHTPVVLLFAVVEG